MPTTPTWKKIGRAAWLSWPSFWLSAMFLITWIRPYTFGVNTIDHLFIVLAMEFLSICSFPWLGGIWSIDNVRTRIAWLVPMAFFCGFPVCGLALAAHHWWPVVFFLGVTFDRFRLISASRQDPTLLHPAVKTFLVSFLCFMLSPTAVSLFKLCFGLPRFGITGEVMARQRVDSDFFPMVVVGVLYYFLMGLWAVRCAVKNPESAKVLPAKTQAPAEESA